MLQAVCATMTLKKPARSFRGGLFSGLANQTDTTSSDGFAPRFLLSYDASDTLTLNAQALKGLPSRRG